MASDQQSTQRKDLWPYVFDCEACLGEGVSEDDGVTICEECGGTGNLYQLPCTILDALLDTFAAQARNDALEEAAMIANDQWNYHEEQRFSDPSDAGGRYASSQIGKAIRALITGAK